MKSNHVYLDQLNPSSKAYKVKVKVIEKGRARTSPKKGILYQNLVLQDDKGNKMRGALFGDQVEGFKEAFVYNGVYEIANAPIKAGSEQWKSSPDELDCQMSFGRQTVIQPLDIAVGSTFPEYRCISQIPKAGSTVDKFDILGVILYVEEKPRQVTVHEREHLVREIVITDHSTEQPLIISAWADLAGAECDALFSWTEKYVVVGFSALKTATHKGFSMATSMSTTFIHEPKGDKAKALEEWAAQHQDTLSSRQARVLDVRNPSEEKLITTIYALKLRKVANTLQEERRWLRVRIPEPDFQRIYAYIGCSNCNRNAHVPVGTKFTCQDCSKTDCVSYPMATFTCEIVDETGSMSVTMFTKQAEVLFRLPAADIFHMKHSENREVFSHIAELLRTTFALVQLGPTSALSRNKVLQWVPKKVELDGDIVFKPETLVKDKPESVPDQGMLASHVTSHVTEHHTQATTNTIVAASVVNNTHKIKPSTTYKGAHEESGTTTATTATKNS